MPKQSQGLLKRLVGALIVVGVGVFFWRAVRSNWAEIQAQHFELNRPYIALGFAAVTVANLLGTYAWQLTLNGLSGRRDMTFSRSVATVNTTSLTKYLPGKFWSYALQMYWLSSSGYSKALVLYVNLTNLAVSLLTGVLLAVGFLLAAGVFPLPLMAGVFLLVAIADLACIFYYGPAFALLARLAKRVLKREIGTFEMPPSLMLRLQGAQLAAQVISGIGGYLVCFGIGYQLDMSTILLVMASLILSDAAGFVFFLVPGGLGVREATMYFLLRGANASSLALVLPLVTRLLYMLADVILGLVALWLLRSSVRAAKRAGAQDDRYEV
jgi:uncharacterized membrane protein YbhN (UPF0104 family)